MLVDMHAHVIPGALDPVGKRDDHKGPRVGPCDDPHARMLENDRMQFKARDAFYSAERRLEELERSEVDAEVVSPMPPWRPRRSSPAASPSDTPGCGSHSATAPAASR